MKRVILRAPVLTQSGYGVHARQFARTLLNRTDIELYIHAVPWGITPWIIDSTRHNGLIGKILNRCVPANDKCDVSIQLQLPDEWDPNLAHKNVGVTALVETDKCNPKWIECINRMDSVVVPCRHNIKTIKNTGCVSTPLVVLREAYFDELLNKDFDDTFLSSIITNFNFLMFGQITGTNNQDDRKNTFNTIKWFCESFKDDKDVGLILKTNSGKNTHTDLQLTSNKLKQVVAEVRVGKYPRIYLLHGDFSPCDINAIYRSKKVRCLLNLTRGESFGLPILEASITGLPSIVTDYSAPPEYLYPDKFLEVQCDIKPIHESRIDNRIFMPGSSWAEVRENHAKKRMQKFRQQPSLPEEWAKSLSDRLSLSHSFKSVEKDINALLESCF
jgi:glycosyltransferase involved in cell wall biosynthesis